MSIKVSFIQIKSSPPSIAENSDKIFTYLFANRNIQFSLFEYFREESRFGDRSYSRDLWIRRTGEVENITYRGRSEVNKWLTFKRYQMMLWTLLPNRLAACIHHLITQTYLRKCAKVRATAPKFSAINCFPMFPAAARAASSFSHTAIASVNCRASRTSFAPPRSTSKDAS